MNALWTIADVAAYFKVSETQAATIVAAEFPKPIVLPSRGRGERHIKRWVPDQVIEWAVGQSKAA